jgi:hypothetical protein
MKEYKVAERALKGIKDRKERKIELKSRKEHNRE